MKRHTCIGRNGEVWGGGVCTSALTDAQYLSYIIFKSFDRRLHKTIRCDFDEILCFSLVDK